MRKHKFKSVEHKTIALERITILFEQARENFKLDPKLSNRYVKLARKISMKYKVKIPSEFKRQFCKHCYSFFMPSVTCRIRTKPGKLIYYCLKCKKFTRIPTK